MKKFIESHMWKLQGWAWLQISLDEILSCHSNLVSLSSSLGSACSVLAFISECPLRMTRCCHTSSIHISSLAQLLQEKKSLLFWYFTQIPWKLSFFGSNCPEDLARAHPWTIYCCQGNILYEPAQTWVTHPTSGARGNVSITQGHKFSATEIKWSLPLEFSHMWVNTLLLCLSQLVLGFL